MQRPITGFERDEAGDWTARLNCGHAQHVRHDPPFVNRPWVTTPEGRATRLGELLDCLRCDRMEMPDHAIAFRQTPEFTAGSVPGALRKDHATAAGTWARIVVTAGTVRYRVPALDVDSRLGPAQPGVVVPETPHSVEPSPDARFRVEFFRVP